MKDEKNKNDKQETCDCRKKTDARKCGETFAAVAANECGKRLCKCGSKHCEFATDFFDESGNLSSDFASVEDLIEKANLEAAEDYSDYARRVGLLGAYHYDGVAENGEALYHNTATYRMIDPDDGCADTGKS